MILLYRAVVNTIYFLLYRWAWLKMASGSTMWRDRLGKATLEPCDIWLHASSVGEITIVSYLADYLFKRQPSLKIHVTTMTASGYATGKARLNGKASLSYFPIDKRSIMRRMLDQLQPKMVIIAETEIWPNLIVECGRSEIVLIKVNARISPKAFRKYQWVRRTIGRLIGRYDRIFCKSEDDLIRYRKLGASDTRTVVGGDMKFDAPLIEKTPDRVRMLRRRIGVEDRDFLLICGSTRPGEEEVLLAAYREVRKEHDHFRMVLAPRHLERLPEVRELITQCEFPVAAIGAASADRSAVLLVEEMGILGELYGAADLSFVGGTLVDIGGHNLLEPVWAQTPVIYGPHLSNVGEAAAYIEEQGYGARLSGPSDVLKVITDVASGKTKFKVKTAEDLSHSAVAMAGQYIIERLNHV